MPVLFNKFMDVILTRVNKLIEDWVEPVTSKQIDISSILTGHVEIKHIQIKQKVTDFFPLPVNLIFRQVIETDSLRLKLVFCRDSRIVQIIMILMYSRCVTFFQLCRASDGSDTLVRIICKAYFSPD